MFLEKSTHCQAEHFCPEILPSVGSPNLAVNSQKYSPVSESCMDKRSISNVMSHRSNGLLDFVNANSIRLMTYLRRRASWRATMEYWLRGGAIGGKSFLAPFFRPAPPDFQVSISSAAHPPTFDLLTYVVHVLLIPRLPTNQPTASDTRQLSSVTFNSDLWPLNQHLIIINKVKCFLRVFVEALHFCMNDFHLGFLLLPTNKMPFSFSHALATHNLISPYTYSIIRRRPGTRCRRI